MGWSLNIGSVAGTAIRIHVTFLLFLAWIFGVSYVSGGAAARLERAFVHGAVVPVRAAS